MKVLAKCHVIQLVRSVPASERTFVRMRHNPQAQ